MFHPHYIARDTVLARCPEAWCRRSGRCRAERDGATPCLRTHETMDDFREGLIGRLAAIMREMGHTAPRQPVDENSLEFQMKYARLKRAFEDHLAAHDGKPRRP